MHKQEMNEKSSRLSGPGSSTTCIKVSFIANSSTASDSNKALAEKVLRRRLLSSLEEEYRMYNGMESSGASVQADFNTAVTSRDGSASPSGPSPLVVASDSEGSKGGLLLEDMKTQPPPGYDESEVV